jgi:hypothetical protein
MVRAQAQRLLPHPQIGVAPTDGTTLVRIQTILWVETASDRDLGTVSLLGRKVAISAHLERVDWRFGDGSAATSDGPGRAYTDADPCNTVRCPGYFGHIYTTTGHPQVTATLTWTGAYRVDGGASQPIPGTVTTDARPTELHVVESRSELVPNP